MPTFRLGVKRHLGCQWSVVSGQLLKREDVLAALGSDFQRSTYNVFSAASCLPLLDVRCWMFDVRCWMLDVGCWMLDVRCSMFDVRCSMFDVRCSMFDVRCWMFDVRCSKSLDVGFPFPLDTSHPRPEIGRRLWRKTSRCVAGAPSKNA